MGERRHKIGFQGSFLRRYVEGDSLSIERSSVFRSMVICEQRASSKHTKYANPSRLLILLSWCSSATEYFPKAYGNASRGSLNACLRQTIDRSVALRPHIHNLFVQA